MNLGDVAALLLMATDERRFGDGHTQTRVAKRPGERIAAQRPVGIVLSRAVRRALAWTSAAVWPPLERKADYVTSDATELR